MRLFAFEVVIESEHSRYVKSGAVVSESLENAETKVQKFMEELKLKYFKVVTVYQVESEIGFI